MQMVLLSRVLLQRVNQELGSMSECPGDFGNRTHAYSKRPERESLRLRGPGVCVPLF